MNELYKKFEIEIRKKLQPFLKNINQYSIKEVNQKDLLESLGVVLKILNKEEKLEYKESVVTLFIKDILNIMNENNLNVEEHSNYIIKLKILIQECLSNLDNVVDKKEISEIEKKLYNDLAGVRMQVISYIKKKNQFYRTYHNYEEDGRKNKK